MGTFWKSKITVLAFLVLFGCASMPVEQQEDANFHIGLGLSYLNEGNYQMAYIQFQAAYKLAPNNKDVLHCLGIVYLQFGDLEKSKKYFLDALSIDENFSEAHNNLGIVYMKTGKWDEAIEHFKKALNNPMYQNPESAYVNLGNVYYKLGKYEISVKTYEDALKRFPGFAPLYYKLALSYNKIGRYGDASEMLTTAIEKDRSYNGDKEKFIQEIKRQYLKSDKGDPDLADFLEIAAY